MLLRANPEANWTRLRPILRITEWIARTDCDADRVPFTMSQMYSTSESMKESKAEFSACLFSCCIVFLWKLSLFARSCGPSIQENCQSNAARSHLRISEQLQWRRSNLRRLRRKHDGLGIPCKTRLSLGHFLLSGMDCHDLGHMITQVPTLQAPKRQGISGSAVLALNSQIAAQIHGYSWLERGVASLRPQTIPLSSSCLLKMSLRHKMPWWASLHSFFPRHSSGGVHSTSLNFERSWHWTHNSVRSSILHPVYTTDIHILLRNSIFRTLWTSVVCLLAPPAVKAEAQRFLTGRPLAGGRSLSQDTPRHSEKHFKKLRFCQILSDSVSIAAASLQPTP